MLLRREWPVFPWRRTWQASSFTVGLNEVNHTFLHSKSGHPTLPFLSFSWHWTVSSVVVFTLALFPPFPLPLTWLPKHASLLHFGLIWNIWSMCNLWAQNVTNSRIALCLPSWPLLNSGYSLTSPPTVLKPWKELPENVAFVFKCAFYLDLFPMPSCLKRSLSALVCQIATITFTFCCKSHHSWTLSRSAFLQHSGWSLVDGVYHPLHTDVRNKMNAKT